MTAPDRRVANAREYLDAIRPHKVSGRPLSVLRRECQELRRQLGQVLHVIEHQAPTLAAVLSDGNREVIEEARATVAEVRADPSGAGEHVALGLADHLAALLRVLDLIMGAPARHTALTPGQAATVMDALDVAAGYREYRASLTCEACATHPAEVCGDHQADLGAVDAYRALAREIGGHQ